MIRNHTQINRRPAESSVEIEHQIELDDDLVTVRFEFRAVPNGDGCSEYSRGWWEPEFVAAWIVDDNGHKVRDVTESEIETDDMIRAEEKAHQQMF